MFDHDGIGNFKVDIWRKRNGMWRIYTLSVEELTAKELLMEVAVLLGQVQEHPLKMKKQIALAKEALLKWFDDSSIP